MADERFPKRRRLDVGAYRLQDERDISDDREYRNIVPRKGTSHKHDAAPSTKGSTTRPSTVDYPNFDKWTVSANTAAWASPMALAQATYGWKKTTGEAPTASFEDTVMLDIDDSQDNSSTGPIFEATLPARLASSSTTSKPSTASTELPRSGDIKQGARTLERKQDKIDKIAQKWGDDWWEDFIAIAKTTDIIDCSQAMLDQLEECAIMGRESAGTAVLIEQLIEIRQDEGRREEYDLTHTSRKPYMLLDDVRYLAEDTLMEFGFAGEMPAGYAPYTDDGVEAEVAALEDEDDDDDEYVEKVKTVGPIRMSLRGR